MENRTLILSDTSRMSLSQWLLPLLMVYLLIVGIAQGDGFTLVLALLVAVYFFFTSHQRYELYPDALVIRYRAPRQRLVSLSDIEAAQIAKIPLRGETVIIRRQSAGPLLILPRNPQEFVARLEETRRPLQGPGE